MKVNKSWSALAIGLGLLGTTNLFAKTYILHINSAQTFERISQSLKESKRNALSTKLQLLGTDADVLESLRHLNMLVINAEPADFAKLKAHGEVSFIEEDQILPLPSPLPINGRRAMPGDFQEEGERPWGLQAVRAQAAWQQGIQGEGVRVMVLDTGIDRDHADIRGRFEAGQNFVIRRPAVQLGLFGNGPNVLAQEPEEPWTPVPYEYFDLNGHGTHCAGTILGEEDNQGVVGVAPRARLLAGRVCGKFGCTLTGIVNGLNWAIEQAVDVVSMSLGGPMPSRAQQDAIEAAERADIVVVAATGNGGMERSNDNRISYPAAYPSVVAVGAVDNRSQRAAFSQWGAELDVVGPGVDVKSSVPTGSGRGSLVRLPINGQLTEVPSASFIGVPVRASARGELVNCGLGTTADFNGLQLAGRFCLIARGQIAFTEKVQNAIRAGAGGAVIYNNVAGLMSGSLSEDGSEVAIPVVMIEQSQGERLVADLRNAPQTVEVQTFATNYATFSGTSMATPHVAGVTALIRGANPQANAAQVREILRSTSQPLTNPTGRNEFGAGLVNAEAGVRQALQQH